MTPLADVRVLDLTSGWQRGVGRFLAELGTVACERADQADLVLDDGHADPEALLAAHPGVVVVTLTDFGRTGPYADWTGSEAVLVALGGVLSRSGLPGRPPVLPPAGLVHGTACVHATWAALVALTKARRTGQGELVDVSALEAVVHGFDPGFGTQGSAAAGRADTFPRGRPDARAFYPVFDCADGQVRICLLAPRQWRAMFAWLGEPDEFADPSFDAIPARFAAADRLHPLLAALFADRTREELAEEGAARGIPIAGVLRADEVGDVPHFAATGALVDGRPTGYLTFDGERGAKGSRTSNERPLFVVADPSVVPVRPLSGLRVLDLGVIVFGAELGRLLADQGAEVIKVESTAFPDGLRQSRRGSGMSVSFAWGQRGKLSLGLDLRTEQGAELFRALVQQSDVVLSNFKPGTLASLGFGDLLTLNPLVVSSESSAFGSSGPWSSRMGYGPLVRASTGVTDLWRDGADPCDGSTVYPDHVAAHVAAVGVLAALLGRAREGRGTVVGTAQSDVALVHLLEAEPEGVSDVHACAGDDDWLAVTLRPGDQARLMDLVDSDDDLGKAVSRWAAGVPVHEAMRALQERGVAAGALLRLPEVLEDPQLVTRQSFAQLSHPDLPGPVPASARVARFSSIPDVEQRPAPELGRDTREVLGRLLGLEGSELDRLIASGVVHCA